jgi:hypothetical protein
MDNYKESALAKIYPNKLSYKSRLVAGNMAWGLEKPCNWC